MHRLFRQLEVFSGVAENFPEETVRFVEVIHTIYDVFQWTKNYGGAEDYEVEIWLLLFDKFLC